MKPRMMGCDVDESLSFCVNAYGYRIGGDTTEIRARKHPIQIQRVSRRLNLLFDAKHYTSLF